MFCQPEPTHRFPESQTDRYPHGSKTEKMIYRPTSEHFVSHPNSNTRSSCRHLLTIFLFSNPASGSAAAQNSGSPTLARRQKNTEVKMTTFTFGSRGVPEDGCAVAMPYEQLRGHQPLGRRAHPRCRRRHDYRRFFLPARVTTTIALAYKPICL